MLLGLAWLGLSSDTVNYDRREWAFQIDLKSMIMPLPFLCLGSNIDSTFQSNDQRVILIYGHIFFSRSLSIWQQQQQQEAEE